MWSSLLEGALGDTVRPTVSHHPGFTKLLPVPVPVTEGAHARAGAVVTLHLLGARWETRVAAITLGHATLMSP